MAIRGRVGRRRDGHCADDRRFVIDVDTPRYRCRIARIVRHCHRDRERHLGRSESLAGQIGVEAKCRRRQRAGLIERPTGQHCFGRAAQEPALRVARGPGDRHRHLGRRVPAGIGGDGRERRNLIDLQHLRRQAGERRAGVADQVFRINLEWHCSRGAGRDAEVGHQHRKGEQARRACLPSIGSVAAAEERERDLSRIDADSNTIVDDRSNRRGGMRRTEPKSPPVEGAHADHRRREIDSNGERQALERRGARGITLDGNQACHSVGR